MDREGERRDKIKIWDKGILGQTVREIRAALVLPFTCKGIGISSPAERFVFTVHEQ